MVIQIHSDASFLSDTKYNRRVVGYHCLSTKSADPNKAIPNQPPLNGPVYVKSTTIQNILTSAMEAEMGAIFVNC